MAENIFTTPVARAAEDEAGHQKRVAENSNEALLSQYSVWSALGSGDSAGAYQCEVVPPISDSDDTSSMRVSYDGLHFTDVDAIAELIWKATESPANPASLINMRVEILNATQGALSDDTNGTNGTSRVCAYARAMMVMHHALVQVCAHSAARHEIVNANKATAAEPIYSGNPNMPYSQGRNTVIDSTTLDYADVLSYVHNFEKGAITPSIPTRLSAFPAKEVSAVRKRMFWYSKQNFTESERLAVAIVNPFDFFTQAGMHASNSLQISNILNKVLHCSQNAALRVAYDSKHVTAQAATGNNVSETSVVSTPRRLNDQWVKDTNFKHFLGYSTNFFTKADVMFSKLVSDGLSRIPNQVANYTATRQLHATSLSTAFYCPRIDSDRNARGTQSDCMYAQLYNQFVNGQPCMYARISPERKIDDATGWLTFQHNADAATAKYPENILYASTDTGDGPILMQFERSSLHQHIVAKSNWDTLGTITKLQFLDFVHGDAGKLVAVEPSTPGLASTIEEAMQYWGIADAFGEQIIDPLLQAAVSGPEQIVQMVLNCDLLAQTQKWFASSDPTTAIPTVSSEHGFLPGETNMKKNASMVLRIMYCLDRRHYHRPNSVQPQPYLYSGVKVKPVFTSPSNYLDTTDPSRNYSSTYHHSFAAQTAARHNGFVEADDTVRGQTMNELMYLNKQNNVNGYFQDEVCMGTVLAGTVLNNPAHRKKTNICDDFDTQFSHRDGVYKNDADNTIYNSQTKDNWTASPLNWRMLSTKNRCCMAMGPMNYPGNPWKVLGYFNLVKLFLGEGIHWLHRVACDRLELGAGNRAMLDCFTQSDTSPGFNTTPMVRISRDRPEDMFFTNFDIAEPGASTDAADSKEEVGIGIKAFLALDEFLHHTRPRSGVWKLTHSPANVRFVSNAKSIIRSANSASTHGLLEALDCFLHGYVVITASSGSCRIYRQAPAKQPSETETKPQFVKHLDRAGMWGIYTDAYGTFVSTTDTNVPFSWIVNDDDAHQESMHAAHMFFAADPDWMGPLADFMSSPSDKEIAQFFPRPFPVGKVEQLTLTWHKVHGPVCAFGEYPSIPTGIGWAAEHSSNNAAAVAVANVHTRGESRQSVAKRLETVHKATLCTVAGNFNGEHGRPFNNMPPNALADVRTQNTMTYTKMDKIKEWEIAMSQGNAEQITNIESYYGAVLPYKNFQDFLLRRLSDSVDNQARFMGDCEVLNRHLGNVADRLKDNQAQDAYVGQTAMDAYRRCAALRVLIQGNTRLWPLIIPTAEVRGTFLNEGPSKALLDKNVLIDTTSGVQYTCVESDDGNANDWLISGGGVDQKIGSEIREICAKYEQSVPSG